MYLFAAPALDSLILLRCLQKLAFCRTVSNLDFDIKQYICDLMPQSGLSLALTVKFNRYLHRSARIRNGTSDTHSGST